MNKVKTLFKKLGAKRRASRQAEDEKNKSPQVGYS